MKSEIYLRLVAVDCRVEKQAGVCIMARRSRGSKVCAKASRSSTLPKGILNVSKNRDYLVKVWSKFDFGHQTNACKEIC